MDAETQPLDEAARALVGESQDRAPRVSLLVYGAGLEGGVCALELEAGESIVIGRERPSDCVVQDPSLSRRHALFTRMARPPNLDAEVQIVDLGARNGVWLRGERVQQATLRAGDEVLLGSVLVEVHVRTARVRPPNPTRVRVPALRGASPEDADDSAPVVASPAMRAVFAQVERAAASLIPVLLQGETGTGKEVVARALHERGARRAGPMVCLNCAGIPETLIESTLFGHERGAFTGAEEPRAGAFEQASGGTLLLDEVGELPPRAQAALLRVLETRRVTRVGSTREREVDVRVLAATNRDLEAMAQEGSFRQDLLFRLNGLNITVPPLRARLAEVRPLAERFLRRAGRSARRVLELDDQALEALEAYSWPGNVRELRYAIERAVVLASGDTLGVQELPERVRSAAPLPERSESAPPPSTDPASGPRSSDLRARVQGYEGRVIEDVLRATAGNQTEAARRLNMPLRTLVRKIKTLGLKPR